MRECVRVEGDVGGQEALGGVFTIEESAEGMWSPWLNFSRQSFQVSGAQS